MFPYMLAYTQNQNTSQSLLLTYAQSSKSIIKISTAVVGKAFLQLPAYCRLSDQELSDLLRFVLGHSGSVDVGKGSEGFVDLLELEAAGWNGFGVGQGEEG